MWGIALVFKGFSVGGERELRTAVEPQDRVKKTKKDELIPHHEALS